MIMLIPETFEEFKAVFLDTLSRMPRNCRYYLPHGFSVASPHDDEPDKRYYPRYYDRYGNLYDDTLIEYSLPVSTGSMYHYHRIIDPDRFLLDVTVNNLVMRRIWKYLLGDDTLFQFPPAVKPPANRFLSA